MVDTVAAPQAALPTRVNALVVLSAMLHAAGMPQDLFCTADTQCMGQSLDAVTSTYMHVTMTVSIHIRLCAHVISVFETPS